jgi:flagellar basal body-associated protein FliL
LSRSRRDSFTTELPMATDDEEESGRDRAITNVIIVAFVVMLIGAGLWLSDAMFHLRKDQGLRVGRQKELCEHFAARPRALVRSLS